MTGVNVYSRSEQFHLRLGRRLVSSAGFPTPTSLTSWRPGRFLVTGFLRPFQLSRPTRGRSRDTNFIVHFRLNASEVFKVFPQHPECVLTHFATCEKLWQRVGEVQSKLESLGPQRNAEIVICQKQAALGISHLTARVQKPRLLAGGIYMKQLQQLLFEMPEITQRRFRNVEHSQEDNRLKEFEIRTLITSAFEYRQLESRL